MAMVTGEWLAYDERAAYLADLRKEKELLVKLVKAGAAVGYDLDRLEVVLDTIDYVARVHRGERDVLYFGMQYASEDANPGNGDNLIPEGVNVKNAADFHKELCGLLDEVVRGEAAQNIAWAVPRGHAKTAWLSNIFLLHQVVYRHKQYIVLISETTDVAGDFIGWARFQLKQNEKLREDFGELLHLQPSRNDTDNKYEFITTTNAKIEAKGLGTQMRGLRHGATRPDLFILDDLESKDSTNTPELVNKSKRWFDEEAMNAMAKGGTCIYLGTILVYDSLLDYVIRERKDFKSRKFAAVIDYAEDERLWDEWLRIYREDDEDSPARAREFFEENEEAMLAGAKVLWPDYWNYYDLMVKKESAGAKAFAQEYQNEPTDEERQVFREEDMVFFDDDDLLDKDLEFFGGIDIAMGKSKSKGDYSVIATVAKNIATGNIYVMDIFVKRIQPNELIRVATEKALEWQYEKLGIEAVFAQEFVADELSRSLRAAGYPAHLRLQYIKDTTNKGIRIEAMQPDIQSGRMRFHIKLKNKLEQLTMYPMHKHDDIPDALAMARKVAQAGTASVTSYDRGSRWGNRRRR